jgi:hypothetical protein
VKADDNEQADKEGEQAVVEKTAGEGQEARGDTNVSEALNR